MASKLPQQVVIGVPALAVAALALTVSPGWACPWIIAAAVYVLFLSHYKNWRGPLTKAEIDRHLANFSSPDTDTETLRAFLEADRGREFFMLNLIEFPEGEIPHPDTGQLMQPHKLVERYSGPFTRKLVGRGGHPLLLMLRRGDNVDSWGTTSETGSKWPLTNIMRYRSRRDFIELCTDPAFADMHRFKRDAITQTISFPNGLMMAVFAGPRIFVPVCLALIAASANLLALALG